MNSITLIFTRHEELGKCNSNELYKILEKVDPNVIFEELPPSSFDDFYLSKNRRSLESDTIVRYVEAYKIPHIGVDSDNIPSERFFSEYNRLFNKIEGLTDINGFTLRNSIDANRGNIQNFGFEYLNSIQSQNYYDSINNAIENGVEKLNDQSLLQILTTWKETNDMRENQMLANIYAYSQEHNFTKAAFTIGAAHRKSIMNKISELEKTEDLKLIWKYYGANASI